METRDKWLYMSSEWGEKDESRAFPCHFARLAVTLHVNPLETNKNRKYTSHTMNFVEELKWRGMLHQMMPGTEELLEKEIDRKSVV